MGNEGVEEELPLHHIQHKEPLLIGWLREVDQREDLLLPILDLPVAVVRLTEGLLSDPGTQSHLLVDQLTAVDLRDKECVMRRDFCLLLVVHTRRSRHEE